MKKYSKPTMRVHTCTSDPTMCITSAYEPPRPHHPWHPWHPWFPWGPPPPHHHGHYAKEDNVIPEFEDFDEND